MFIRLCREIINVSLSIFYLVFILSKEEIIPVINNAARDKRIVKLTV